MNTMPLHTDIKKKIKKVIEAAIGEKGLELVYDYDGIEKTIIKSPEITCQLLKLAGLINNFCGSGSDITIELVTELNESDHNGQHVQRQLVQHPFWEDFILFFNLSASDAIAIITEYEHAKELKAWYDNIAAKTRNEYQLLIKSHSQN